MRHCLRVAIVLCLAATAAFCQPYQPTQANLEAREWFQDAKFGLFIHWGVYSVPGMGEWVMENQKIPITEYEKLPPKFNPTAFDAAAWVAMAKNAGMKYITITSKHHDGFAMFATRQNSWSIVDATPYAKDPLKMLAEECRRQGLKLFFYYSQLDWHHPDYFPRGRTGASAGRPEWGDFNRYLDFMDAQLTELLTNYGDVAGIWFDGMWDKPKADWRLAQTYALIHRLQPAALVGSNHHLAPFEGEDFQMFEKDLPGQNTAGFSGEAKIGTLPLETCETINNSWGYNKNDRRFKPARDLIHYLVRAAGNNANFLLNVGPMPDGTMQPEFQTRLAEMGRWLSVNGEAIYGTRGGPFPPRPWGAATQKGNKIYIHILDWKDELLALPKLPAVRKAAMLDGGAAVEVRQMESGTLLRLPVSQLDPLGSVVVLETVP